MIKKITIPFNKPHLTHKEMGYIAHAHALGQLSGDGFYTKKCHTWFEKNFDVQKCLLTHSCTGALEIMAMLADLKPGDEVIMPSFTFVSTANAIALRGAVPVFVDIRADTLNIDENLIEKAITKKTKAIMVVHYAGVGCEMDTILAIAKKYNLLVLEDAAQGVLARYKGKFLGTIGDLGAYSFHETKNVISGEGGALTINDKKFNDQAEIIREKGTNRSKFLRGQVDKYSWVDIGSSYLPGEIIAAFLLAQLEHAYEITKGRLALWNYYHASLQELEEEGLLRRPIIPEECEHNAHIYHVLVKDLRTRSKLTTYLKKRGILSVSHYVPLHSSIGGKKYGRKVGEMTVTDSVSDRLIRLPLFYDITYKELEEVIVSVKEFFKNE